MLMLVSDERASAAVTSWSPPQESSMYVKPAVQKYGSFRELTQVGFQSASDGASIRGIGTGSGCWTEPNSAGAPMIHCPSAS